MTGGDLDDVQKPEIRGPFYDTTTPREREPHFDTPGEDLKAKKEWMDDKLEKRLKGEYESMGRRLQEIVEDSRDAPARLSAIRIDGSTLRSSFLASIFKQHLDEDPARTFTDVLRKSRDVHANLAAFDLFSAMEAKLEPAQSLLARQGDVDLALKVIERGRLWAKSSTDVGNGEGSANISVRLRNVFGGAESLEAQASYGTRTTSAFNISYSSPIPEFIMTPSPTTRLTAQIFQADRDHSAYAGVKEFLFGARGSINSLKSYGAHEVTYEAVSRTLGALQPNASLSLREAAGSSIKSSVAHTFTHDSRDDVHMSTQGGYFNTLLEYAGLGGTVNFLKAQLQTSMSRPIDTKLQNYISLTFRTGALLPLGGSMSEEYAYAKLFSDRFRLGGPTSVRMFGMNRLGPRDQEDHIGGDLYYSGGLSLTTPFPTKPHWNLKCQAFLNAGQLVSLKNRDVTNALMHPSLSAGLGFVYRFNPIRVELNFGVPLLASVTDVGTSRPCDVDHDTRVCNECTAADGGGGQEKAVCPEDTKEYLRKYFSQFGELKSIYVQNRVPTWSNSKYAFVCYGYAEDAAEAKEKATRIGTSNLNVEYGREDSGRNDIAPSNSLIIRNINSHHTTKAVRASLEKYGKVVYMTALRRPVYGVCYQRLRDAKKAHTAIRSGKFYKGAIVDYDSEEYIASKIEARGLSSRNYRAAKERESNRFSNK
ncbi:hypothetical protein E3Q24_01769 [Wallemia mellicola]|nr:hypothetical protein E3Q24_01769 [Wallemia mellicola]